MDENLKPMNNLKMEVKVDWGYNVPPPQSLASNLKLNMRNLVLRNYRPTSLHNMMNMLALTGKRVKLEVEKTINNLKYIGELKHVVYDPGHYIKVEFSIKTDEGYNIKNFTFDFTMKDFVLEFYSFRLFLKMGVAESLDLTKWTYINKEYLKHGGSIIFDWNVSQFESFEKMLNSIERVKLVFEKLLPMSIKSHWLGESVQKDWGLIDTVKSLKEDFELKDIDFVYVVSNHRADLIHIQLIDLISKSVPEHESSGVDWYEDWITNP